MKNFLYNLNIFHSRLSASLSSENYLHSARFARAHELTSITRSTFDETSLLLGEGQYNHILHVQPTTARRELGNLLVVAPTRGGKTLLQESQLLTWNHSAIVNDIKGELFEHTAGYRATLGKVYVIDPISGVGHRYDPLEGRTRERELYSSARHLLYDPHDKEAIFTERATKMLTQLFLASRVVDERPLPYVGKLVNFGLSEVAKRLNAVSPFLAGKFLDAEYKPNKDFEEDKFRASAWGTLSARLYPLLTSDIVRCFDGSDFEVSDLLFSNIPVTIYLKWHESELQSLAPLIRLVWESMINELITAYDHEPDKKKCQPVLLDIEEAGRTGIPLLPEHSSTVNGRGISMLVAVQSNFQLDGLYGRYRADTLRNNMDSQIYYRQASHETAQYLEDRLGKKSGFAHSSTTHAESESKGEVEHAIALMTSQAIMQLEDTQIIGFHRNLPPFKAKRMDWQRFPILQERRSIAPPRLPILPSFTSRLIVEDNWRRASEVYPVYRTIQS